MCIFFPQQKGQSNSELDVKIGVSRLGSGSHTMAYYLANKYNLNKSIYNS
jgi:hypothetical protein